MLLFNFQGDIRMIKSLLNARVNAKIAAGLIAIVAVGGVGMKVKESHAQSTSSFTGSCGMLFSRNFTGMEAALVGANNILANSLVTMNWDTSTAQVTNTSISAFGQAGAATSQATSTLAFTKVAGPNSGSYTVTITGTSVVLNVLPVNGGNTFLIQQVSNGAGISPATGVCQKV